MNETRRVCEECGKPAREGQLVLIPGRREDLDQLWVICQGCLEGIEEQVDMILLENK